MKKRASQKSSLIFARRNSTFTKSKRGRKLFSSKKFFIFLGLILLGFSSLYTGHLFAKNTPIPFFLKSKEPKVVIQPFVEPKKKKISVEELLESKNISYEKISYATTSSTAVITLQKNSFVYIDSSGNIENQIHVLSNVLERLKIENPGKVIGYIDLRYDRPLVKF